MYDLIISGVKGIDDGYYGDRFFRFSIYMVQLLDSIIKRDAGPKHAYDFTQMKVRELWDTCVDIQDEAPESDQPELLLVDTFLHEHIVKEFASENYCNQDLCYSENLRENLLGPKESYTVHEMAVAAKESMDSGWFPCFSPQRYIDGQCELFMFIFETLFMHMMGAAYVYRKKRELIDNHEIP